MRPTREMYEREIAELKDVELQLLLEIAELKDSLDKYDKGYKGSCYACEPVGELNVKLTAKIAELKASLHEAIQLLHGSQADAIREMLADVDIGYDSMYQEIEVIEVTDVIKYIESLEKE